MQRFWRRLEHNLFALRRELIDGSYTHGTYQEFFVNDPKPRHIHSATVRDRIVHQALCAGLTRVWEPRLICDVYSARIGKGTHYGVNRLADMLRRVSRNFTRCCWALKCDIRKFYDSIDHGVLLALLSKRIADPRMMHLVGTVIASFNTAGSPGLGVPIGNVTSQIFTNIYLNELDRYVKQELRVRSYGRFADDFILVSAHRSDLLIWQRQIRAFLAARLRLALHPNKVLIRPLHQGIDFLGYVLLPHYRIVRTSTRRRMWRRLAHRAQRVVDGGSDRQSQHQSLASYLGVLSHADAFELRRMVQVAYGSIGRT